MTSTKPLKDSHQNGSKHLSRERLRPRRSKSFQRPLARRQISIARLPSEEDLLGRRMLGVAGGLMGMTNFEGDS